MGRKQQQRIDGLYLQILAAGIRLSEASDLLTAGDPATLNHVRRLVREAQAALGISVGGDIVDSPEDSYKPAPANYWCSSCHSGLSSAHHAARCGPGAPPIHHVNDCPNLFAIPGDRDFCPIHTVRPQPDNVAPGPSV